MEQVADEFREEQTLDNIGSAIEDCQTFVDFALTTLGVDPKHCIVMAEDEDYKNIVREVRDWPSGKNTAKLFYPDAKDKNQHDWW